MKWNHSADKSKILKYFEFISNSGSARLYLVNEIDSMLTCAAPYDLVESLRCFVASAGH